MRPRLSSTLRIRLKVHLRRLPAEVAGARFARIHGDQLDRRNDSTTGWMLGSLGGFIDRSKRGTLGEIRSWLEQRPRDSEEVIIEGLKRCPESDEFRYHAFNVLASASTAPPHRWTLDAGVSTKPLRWPIEGRRSAEHLLELAWRSHTDQRGNEGLSLELLIIAHAREES